MTKEERQLLLKDLCAREPYHPRINVFNQGYEGFRDGEFDTNLQLHYIDAFRFDRIKVLPYLRPVSGMTESEIDRLFDILNIDKEGNDDDWIKINDATGIKFFFPTGKWIEDVSEAYDYLNSIHAPYKVFYMDKGWDKWNGNNYGTPTLKD